MKKVFYLLIVMFGLISCSTDDDYCGNDYYETYKLNEQRPSPTSNLQVIGLQGDSFTVIRSEHEFQDRVRGAVYYRGQIDWRNEDLIIGQVYVNGFRSVINFNSIFKESCNNRNDNYLRMKLNLSKGQNNNYITYHAIVRKLYNTNTQVTTDIEIFN
ncbi:hypothetical protein [Myroides sp. LoEW2-1]|uniref:hypothetical protein n=1 Tax=Myroides sp. LoEW2-1 TaxID=2683192 RepID=UPI0013239901|nr:hypothetical protein [Myroides sp. LoEW2-1]MVX36427.1 hypothetical protein [Myroides sp. LoEW2-1]